MSKLPPGELGEPYENAAPQEIVVEENKITMLSKRKLVVEAEKILEAALQEARWLQQSLDTAMTAITEAINNAVIHGCLRVREGASAPGYETKVAEAEKKYGDIKHLYISYAITDTTIKVEIEDEGKKPFVPKGLPDPLAPKNLLKESGRGIMIMETIGTVSFTQGERGGTLVTLEIKKETQSA
ncbi:hypothetical protein A3J43_02175 [Candidatus Uhrbacteria bacterium RIFCSPHIGHO2_12_FULL_54_23]|uniref:Histidine kinase/HSP90-like ATPase domain-containing protein n=3 Tax=Candidatus Uhriibacteriota TaxID=1752732 RepID=A0A1F7UK99_9BACT|nr:MAG: hypothetical protein A3J43_02175 [Candidatus Uhrbacteria bacterium RIFCSPHIGHO2_12_FULL_54_23]OGL84415.1 MAG: hypothetical protein A3B36_02860 [Candidatus Uhrbacteria bacterium RIFCSPLOWO2_01_FULL_55_36]OGL90463.1 MAG: hypothetical protein A3J36_00810 [Candidatus Uhrbacteria bacterium RIFCSPLOWO2_02_FULL_54_37]